MRDQAPTVSKQALAGQGNRADTGLEALDGVRRLCWLQQGLDGLAFYQGHLPALMGQPQGHGGADHAATGNHHIKVRKIGRTGHFERASPALADKGSTCLLYTSDAADE